MAEALSAELYVLHVEGEHDGEPDRKHALDTAMQLAQNLGAHVQLLKGKDTAQTTAAFVRDYRITQARLGRSATHGLRSYLYYFALQRFMAEAPHVDLHIVTQETR